VGVIGWILVTREEVDVLPCLVREDMSGDGVGLNHIYRVVTGSDGEHHSVRHVIFGPLVDEVEMAVGDVDSVVFLEVRDAGPYLPVLVMGQKGDGASPRFMGFFKIFDALEGCVGRYAFFRCGDDSEGLCKLFRQMVIEFFRRLLHLCVFHLWE